MGGDLGPAGGHGQPHRPHRARVLTVGWDPAQYLTFAGPRLRPAVDLLNAVPAEGPEAVVDLGCGPGNVTARLAARWPEALVSGLDSSPEMIAAARADFPGIRFDVGEIEAWSGSPGKTDVVFSNAALHWVGDHEQLFPRLLGQVAPGGYLAVQMPLSFKEPSHTLAAELAADPEWAPKLDEALPRSPVAEPVDYHRWLAPVSSHLDVWETTYVHELTGPDPVFEWFRGSWLRPVLSRLDADEAGEFERRYRLALADHYPPDPSGAVLLPFRRVFVVASPEPSAASFG